MSQDQTTRAELAQALSDWRGCGCCSSGYALAESLGDECPNSDGWVDHTYGDGCVLSMGAADLLPRLVAKWETSR